MFTLSNPRHETFALSLARGATPEAAYRAARVTHLKTCLPHIDALRDRFAPSILLMPQTQDEMQAWLWQVMNGARKILPIQLRAANLFIRLNGWHLHPSTSRAHRSSESEGGSSIPHLTVSPSDSLKVSQSESLPPSASPVPLTPTDHERHLLAHLSSHIIANDLAQRPVYPKEIHPFYSTMADIALIQQSTPVAACPSDVSFETLVKKEAAPAHCSLGESGAKEEPHLVPDSQSEAQSSPVAPQLVVPPKDQGFSTSPAASPDGEPQSPSQLPDPQPVILAKSPNGDKIHNSPQTRRQAPAAAWHNSQKPRPKALACATA